MINLRRYTYEDEEIWNSFNADSKNSLFMFDRNYMDYHKERFKDHSLLFFDDDELIAILPLSESENILFSHGGLTYGGFIVNDKMKQSSMLECVRLLVDYCKTREFNKLIYKCIPFIYCHQPSEEDQYALFRYNARILKIEPSTVVNLSTPLQMAKLRKRKIKQAIKNNVVLKEYDDEKNYEQFITLQNEVLNKHHGVNAVHTSKELFYLHKNFPENIRIFAAELDGTMIAGTVIFEYESVIHTQYLAANDLARQCGALDLVISNIIDKYKYKKLWLDFGISTEKGGTVLNEGLISQKEGFGGRTVAYRTLELII